MFLRKSHNIARRFAGILCRNTALAGTVLFITPAMVHAAAQEQQNAGTEEIIVTGSRIVQSGFETPTPVTLVTSDQLSEKAPTSIPDALKQLPAFQGSGGYTSTSQARGALGADSTSAGAYLNLRGIGSNRTLSLLDGLRVSSSTSQGGVNTDMFPQLLLQRVDVITGGASAAYGSDAIAGVANFVIDKEFEGVKGVLGGGISQKGDMKNYRAGVAAGGSFAGGRLHLLGSGEYYHNGGIPVGGGYPFQDPPAHTLQELQNMVHLYGWGGKYGLVGPNGGLAGTADNPFVLYKNTRFAGNSIIGVAKTGPFANMSILNGQLVPFPETLVSGVTCINCPNSFGGVNQNIVPLIPRHRTAQLFGRAAYEINDNLTAWTQVAYGYSRDTADYWDAYYFSSISIFPDNAFLPQAARDLLISTNTPSIAWSQTFRSDYFPSGGDSDTSTKALNIFAGLDGKIGDTWRWNTAFTYSHSDYLSKMLKAANYGRLAAAVDAVVNPANGQIVCRITLTNPGIMPGCLPLNIFGYNVASPAAAAWIASDGFLSVVSDLREIQGSVTGDLFDIWAGTVKAAAGAGYREETVRVRSDQQPGTFPTPTDNWGIRGLRAVAKYVTDYVWSDGKNKVKEGFAELSIPLVKEVPFIQSLDLDSAARVTDYTFGGSVVTWKASADWAVNEQVRLRGTISRDIRAPSLGELFGGQSGSLATTQDTHTGQAVATAVPVLRGSNAGLKPEKSTALTGGIVLEPEWVDGLRLSVDYWQFKIKNAIAAPYTHQQKVTLCEQSNGTGSTCKDVIRVGPFSDRSASNTIVRILNTIENAAVTNVRGVDVEASYRTPVFAGEIEVRTLTTYLDKYETINAPGQGAFTYVGNLDSQGGLPRLRATLQVKYSQDNWSVQIQERMIGKLHMSNIFVVDPNGGGRIPAMYYMDLNASYNFEVGDATMQVYANIANVMDKTPPLRTPSMNISGPPVNYPTPMALYDVIGRNFNAGLRFRF